MLFDNSYEWDDVLASAIDANDISTVHAYLLQDPAVNDRISLSYLILYASIEVLEIFLKAGCSRRINDFDDVVWSPLMHAVDSGDCAKAALLLRYGADVNGHDESRIGDTALRQAAYKSNLQMIQLLLDAGADPTIPGWMNLTALDVAEEKKTEDGDHISLEAYQLLKAAKEHTKGDGGEGA